MSSRLKAGNISKIKPLCQSLIADWETCLYIISQGSRLLLVDAGVYREEDFKKLDKLVEKLGGWSRVSAVILTHGHADHTGLARGIAEKCSAPIYLHEGDRWMMEDYERYLKQVEELLEKAVKRGFPRSCVEYHGAKWSQGRLDYELTFWSGERLRLADLEAVEVLHTPGHTAGSCSVAVEDVAFTGDTVADVSVLTSDLEQHIKSLKLLSRFREFYTAHYGVIPGETALKLADHYLEKLEAVITATRSPNTFYKIFKAVYGEPKSLGFRAVFALRNLFTYLDFLERHGFVEVMEGEPPKWRSVGEASKLREVLR